MNRTPSRTAATVACIAMLAGLILSLSNAPVGTKVEFLAMLALITSAYVALDLAFGIAWTWILGSGIERRPH